MWCWGWKQRDLYRLIMSEADNENGWEFGDMYASHKKSDIALWIGGWWFQTDIYDWRRNGKQSVGFSLMQRWKIHRKLKKLGQKLIKAKALAARGGFETKAGFYLAEMVAANLTGESRKK